MEQDAIVPTRFYRVNNRKGWGASVFAVDEDDAIDQCVQARHVVARGNVTRIEDITDECLERDRLNGDRSVSAVTASGHRGFATGVMGPADDDERLFANVPRCEFQDPDGPRLFIGRIEPGGSGGARVKG